MPQNPPPSKVRSPRKRAIALVIGNGHYPDAHAPLAQPVNDARALMWRCAATLRRRMVEDAGKDDMNRAIERLKSKIAPESVVMLFFGGFGVQVGREAHEFRSMPHLEAKPTCAARACSIEAVLEAIKAQGARARLAHRRLAA